MVYCIFYGHPNAYKPMPSLNSKYLYPYKCMLVLMGNALYMCSFMSSLAIKSFSVPHSVFSHPSSVINLRQISPIVSVGFLWTKPNDLKWVFFICFIIASLLASLHSWCIWFPVYLLFFLFWYCYLFISTSSIGQPFFKRCYL